MDNEFPPPRAAYLHVPFCARRCGYCNFTLVAGRDDLVRDYLRAIEIELASLQEPREIDTLFFGGGTPTQLDDNAFEQLVRAVRRWLPLAEGYEFSVEANPADVNAERLRQFAELGVNRLSLGGQSFSADKLRLLERDHSPEQLLAAVEAARRHIRSVGVDLIFGSPGETADDWRRDLATLLELRPDHVSTYGLTFEKGTTFWGRRERGELPLVGEELERTMYLDAIEILSAAGFEHYEVSNFARPGHRCRHNETYWLGDSYYAFGPGAARYVGGRRTMNHRSTTTYLKRVLEGNSPVAEEEQLPPERRARELLAFSLRRMAGVQREAFQQRTGYALDKIAGTTLPELVERNLLADDGGTVRFTREGLLVSDAILARLLRYN